MTLEERARRAADGVHTATSKVQARPLKQPQRPTDDPTALRRRSRVTVAAAAIVTAAAVVAVVALTQQVAGSRPDRTTSPLMSPGLILYGRWHSDAQASNWFTIRPDGTGVRNLHVRATCATWFPDGSKILITNDGRVDRHHPLRPATINPDGSGLRPLNGVDHRALNLGCGDVSPDGSTIAVEGFDDARQNVDGIYLVSALDGGHLRRITRGPDSAPRFSPDGQQIVFLRTKPGLGTEGAGALYVSATAGQTAHRITPWGFAFLGYDWSPDGKWIVFQRPYGQLYLVHPDGSGLRRIPLRLPPGAGAQNPAWSPDSRSIVFSLRSGGHANLYVSTLDGSGLRRVTDGSTEDQTPDWAP